MSTYRSTPAHAGTGLGPRLALARLVTAVASLVAGVIVLAVALRLLGANLHNDIVHAIEQAGRWLTTPFHNLFSVSGDWHYVVNWGIAALVYLVVARLIARVLAA